MLMMIIIQLVACSSKNVNVHEPTSSIESYIYFLETYNEDDAIAAGVHPDHAETSMKIVRAQAEKVKEMNKEEQAELLELLQDPSKIRDLDNQ